MNYFVRVCCIAVISKIKRAVTNRAWSVLVAKGKSVMSNAIRTLATSLLAVLLLVDASGSRSQTLKSERVESSSRDEQRLARFEKQADELRTLLKIPGLSAVDIY